MTNEAPQMRPVSTGGEPYGFTEEEWMFKENVRQYLEENVKGKTYEIGKDEATEKAAYNKWLKDLGDMGAFRAWIPEPLGGYGMRLQMAMAVVEECARVNGGLAIAALENPMFGLVMGAFAPAAFAKYSDKVFSGEWLLGISECAPEGQANWAEQADIIDFDEETQEWVLNGEKAFCSNGTLCDILCISGLYKGTKHTVVITDPQNYPGLTVHHNPEFGPTGWYASLTLDNVRVPKDMGGRFPGGAADHHGLPGDINSAPFPVGCGYLNLGTMEAALEDTIEYMNTRTFNYRPLSSLGEIQHRLVDMKIKVESVRSLLATATAMIQDNHKDALLFTRLAKAYASEVSRDVTTECAELWGTLGANIESGISQHIKDAIGFGIGVCPPSEQYPAAAKEMGFDCKDNDVYVV